jgi:hypothetical protein
VFGARRVGVVGLIALSKTQLSGGRVFGRVAVGREEFWCGHRRVRSIQGDRFGRLNLRTPLDVLKVLSLSRQV